MPYAWNIVLDCFLHALYDDFNYTTKRAEKKFSILWKYT